ncbi:hypothetical protein F4678DRAFT_193544 [Xylaria arbuscula]|nr:hypothetical protein F4678DRAFT_193544 [Xylaria arbuscula]
MQSRLKSMENRMAEQDEALDIADNRARDLEDNLSERKDKYKQLHELYLVTRHSTERPVASGGSGELSLGRSRSQKEKSHSADMTSRLKGHLNHVHPVSRGSQGSKSLRSSGSTSKLTAIEGSFRKLPPGSAYDPSLSDDSIENYEADIDFSPSDDPIESERGSDDDHEALEINLNDHDDLPALPQVEESGLSTANSREELKNFVLPAAHARLSSKTIETKDKIILDVTAERESNQRKEETCCQEAQLGFGQDPAIGLNCTSEEPEGMNLFQDVLFAPQSLPEFIDMIFDLFNILSVEELLGRTRVRWSCQCGTQLYDDLIELAPDSLGLLQLQLQQIKDA